MRQKINEFLDEKCYWAQIEQMSFTEGFQTCNLSLAFSASIYNHIMTTGELLLLEASKNAFVFGENKDTLQVFLY